jgi:hypothetical protein
VQGLGFRALGSGCVVQGLGLRGEGLGFRVEGLGSRAEGRGFRVSPGSSIKPEGGFPGALSCSMTASSSAMPTMGGNVAARSIPPSKVNSGVPGDDWSLARGLRRKAGRGGIAVGAGKRGVSLPDGWRGGAWGKMEEAPEGAGVGGGGAGESSCGVRWCLRGCSVTLKITRSIGFERC